MLSKSLKAYSVSITLDISQNGRWGKAYEI